MESAALRRSALMAREILTASTGPGRARMEPPRFPDGSEGVQRKLAACKDTSKKPLGPSDLYCCVELLFGAVL